MRIQNNTLINQKLITNIEHSTYTKITKLFDRIFKPLGLQEHVAKIFKHNLLSDGINCKYKGWTLLHLCVFHYNNLKSALQTPWDKNLLLPLFLELIGFLIDNKCDLNIKDDFGRTPIYFASDEEILNFLISKGAELTNGANVSSLHILSYLSRNMLPQLNAGADAYAIDKFGRLPLHCATLFSSNGFNIRTLIKYAPLATNIKDTLENYPLFYAIRFGFEYPSSDNDTTIEFILENSSYLTIEEVAKTIKSIDDDYKAEFKELYDPVYNVDYELGIWMRLKGGGPKRRNILSQLNQKAEEKKKLETFEDKNGVKYYLHPDQHGIKHIKLSKVMTSDSNNKKITSKKFIAKYQNQPATFSNDYAENYKEKLSEVIKRSVLSGDFENGVTVFDMGEFVGWDRAEPTQFIELYYNEELGSHMRPKDVTQ